jgi:hypothetical protein
LALIFSQAFSHFPVQAFQNHSFTGAPELFLQTRHRITNDDGYHEFAPICSAIPLSSSLAKNGIADEL